MQLVGVFNNTCMRRANAVLVVIFRSMGVLADTHRLERGTSTAGSLVLQVGRKPSGAFPTPACEVLAAVHHAACIIVKELSLSGQEPPACPCTGAL